MLWSSLVRHNDRVEDDLLLLKFDMQVLFEDDLGDFLHLAQDVVGETSSPRPIVEGQAWTKATSYV